MKLDKKQILEYQKNRFPFLMIDYATEVIPGKSSKGYKLLPEGEWFFNVHWEDDPNMPGMLQVEALIQMTSLALLTLEGNKGKILYLLGADKLKFYKKVTPNSELLLDTSIIEFKRGIARCKGFATIKDEKVCEAEYRLLLPEELIKYKKQ